MFDLLFSPLRIGNVTLPNRICFLAHRTNFARQGALNERHLAYYHRRARGGCGLVVLGELSVHPNDRPWETLIEAYHPHAVKDFRRLTGLIHETETRIFVQLGHRGFQGSGAITRQPVWGPSAVADIVFGETAKPMEPEDMEEALEAFAKAAVFAREGGFDGIEIDMGPESLLRQFLSPISNCRTDEYGGSLANRLRFPLGVLESARKAVGRDYTLGVRLCADERFWGGITPEESTQAARELERTGHCDFINISVGTYYNLHLILASMHTAPGLTVELAERVRKAVSIPVIASHQIDFPRMAEDILLKGQADAVGLVRQLICDPDAPRKARTAGVEDIRSCVRDNKGCIGRVNQMKALGCTQNPSVGYEGLDETEGLPGARPKKRVLVVGGGPGGMEAARAAGARGHYVTLYEKEPHLGGQVNLIVRRPGRHPMGGIIRHLDLALKKLGVRVVTGLQVTPEFVLREDPDAVIVATGSKPGNRPLPGEYGPPGVLDVWEALSGAWPVGPKVLFVDENGGHHATATVEMLADQGKAVTMVTSDLFIGMELGPLGDLYLSRQRLLQKGVTFVTDVVMDRIENRKAVGRDIYTNEPVHFEGLDTIILDMGNVAEEALYFQLKGKVREIHRIGDCVAPRGIDTAILEARRAGESL
ncbi:MAG: FAD-dependent oxidoreductase [Thermodesulfobacteriota bacterium]